MSGKDDDKTVFGAPLPKSAPQSDSPFSSPSPAPRPVPRPEDRTVIGGGVPNPQNPPGRVAPAGQPQPFGQPPGGDTWLGGAVPPAPPAGQPPAGYPPARHSPPEHSPIGQSPIGQAPTPNAGFFPEMPGQGAGQPQQQQPLATPRISLDQALRATGLGKGASSNPLIAAAANLLILFGRLRTGLVEMDAVPLMEHVTREIDLFERNALQAGVDPHEAQVAKYALCGTADDIVQNLPGADRGVWIQYSMVARFFHKRDSGVGFFQEAEKAMQAPAQRYHLLELMLVCLSLGFEGQYRTMPNGGVDLGRIRAAIYESLRRVKPRADDDISVRWAPVPLGKRRRFGGLSIWVLAGVAAALVVAFFATLSTLIARDGAVVERSLLTLHPGDAPLSIERSGLQALYEPEITQLERIREALAPEIEQGLVDVGAKGDFIFVRVGNLLLFDSGKADVREDFAPLAARIAETVNNEGGPVQVVGFTDSIPMSGRGRFKTNLDLSVARATSVKDMLAGMVEDATRLSVEGKGAADPIGDNATAEGRALNRRVEIMIAREGTF